MTAAVVRFDSTAGLQLDRLEAVWLDRVDERERRTVRELRSPDDRRDLLAAHALARVALAERTGADLATLRIGHDEHGRPTTDDQTIRLSLTHGRGLVACAIGSGAIGIDAEPLASADRLEHFVDDVFDPRELDWVRARTEPGGRDFRLVQLWTAKEAVLKARGRGLRGGGRHPLRSIVLAPAGSSDDGAALVSDHGERVWTWSIDGTHLVSVALAASPGGLVPPSLARLSLAADGSWS